MKLFLVQKDQVFQKIIVMFAYIGITELYYHRYNKHTIQLNFLNERFLKMEILKFKILNNRKRLLISACFFHALCFYMEYMHKKARAYKQAFTVFKLKIEFEYIFSPELNLTSWLKFRISRYCSSF